MSRPYAYVLAERYNAMMGVEARQRGLHWYVGRNGEVKIGYTDAASSDNARYFAQRQERERAAWKRNTQEQPRPDDDTFAD